MDFVVIKDFQAPYVVSTGMPHKPSQIKMRRFNKGQIVTGELKKENGIVLHKGVIPLPLVNLKQVITKDISNVSEPKKEENASSVDGTSVKIADKKISIKDSPEDRKKKYLDGIILGGLIGFGCVYYAEKKGYIAMPEDKNKIIGTVVGALAGAYIVYRFVLDKK